MFINLGPRGVKKGITEAVVTQQKDVNRSADRPCCSWFKLIQSYSQITRNSHLEATYNNLKRNDEIPVPVDVTERILVILHVRSCVVLL